MAYTKQMVMGQMQRFLNAPYEDLLATSKASSSKLLNSFFRQGISYGDSIELVIQIIRTAIVSDGTISPKEEKLIFDTFTPESATYIRTKLNVGFKFLEKKTQAACAKMFSSFSEEDKLLVLNIVSAFSAVDGRFDESELELILKLLNG